MPVSLRPDNPFRDVTLFLRPSILHSRTYISLMRLLPTISVAPGHYQGLFITINKGDTTIMVRPTNASSTPIKKEDTGRAVAISPT